MASFLQNLINNATNSMSEGIKKRVDDGTFNRLASDFGRDISSLGAGMANLVSMAEGAFGKLKNKVAEAKANREQERAERKAEQEERERKAEQLRAERLALMEKEQQSCPAPAEASSENDEEEPYVAPIALTDGFMERLARDFDIQSEDDLHMLCLTRLTAQTALFFANCDGDYTEKEREQIDIFKEMVYDYLDGMEEGSSDAIEFLFDGLDRPCSFDDILAMTHRFTDGLDEKSRLQSLESIDWLGNQIMNADKRQDMRTEDYYNMWRREFGL